jgi:hypothetical protein|tara:strand:+ start:6681 stop:7160 length:480 start_codon:yes stop_codon:yes gene_type:complete
VKLSLLLESKKLRVFDFDDTLVHTSSDKKPQGFDGDRPLFPQFDTVVGPKKIPQIFKVLKNVLNKGSSGRKTVVLTARSKGNPVKGYLKQVGANVQVIPMPLSSQPAKFKKRWIEKQIEDGYDDIEVFDDNASNIQAFNALKNKYPDVKIIVRKVNYKA